MKSKKFLSLFLITALLFSMLCACSEKNNENNPSVIGELAYDRGISDNNTIYLKENGKYVPFIVLENRSDNTSLLIREHLLDDYVMYNEGGEYSAYYEDSIVDRYLTSEYYPTLSDEVKNIIVNTDIEITSKQGIDNADGDKTTISRNVFILSANETTNDVLTQNHKEGTTINYFRKVENRKASHDNGDFDSYFTRTPNTTQYGTIYGIDSEGTLGIGGINTIAGISETNVRPAFSVKSSVEIKESSEIIQGMTVYCIK